ncbi:thioesterase family protein [Jatrophihabitans sp. YIM 134969]
MGFDDDTRVTPAPGGGHDASVGARWDGAPGVPNGGYLMSIATRALAADMPLPDPVSVSAVFLRPGRHGAAHVATAVHKAGRRIAFGSAVLTQEGDEVVRVQAAFADLDRPDAPDLAHERLTPPDLPPVEQCLDPTTLRPEAASHAESSVMGRLELRYPELPGWAQGRPSGFPTSALWLRMRDGREPDPLALVQFADGMPPVVADLGVWSTTVELTVHVRARPVPGWLRAVVDTRHVGHGFHEEEVDLWDSSDTLVAQSRQLALVLPMTAVGGR